MFVNTYMFFCLVHRMKAYSLPPLYRFTKQNENVRTAQLMERSAPIQAAEAFVITTSVIAAQLTSLFPSVSE